MEQKYEYFVDLAAALDGIGVEPGTHYVVTQVAAWELLRLGGGLTDRQLGEAVRRRLQAVGGAVDSGERRELDGEHQIVWRAVERHRPEPHVPQEPEAFGEQRPESLLGEALGPRSAILGPDD